MTAAHHIRPGAPGDASACAAILNDWIDARSWMPRKHSRADVEAFYADFVFRERAVWVTGQPLCGFMALDLDADQITALYVAKPGQGIGKAFVDHAKSRHSQLSLWTFQANTGARRFYAREGFVPLRETDGENEEGLPDIQFGWPAAHWAGRGRVQ